MDVIFSTWTNELKFKYNNIKNEEESKENTFMDKFEIKYITTNYDYINIPSSTLTGITLKYIPYQITCQIWSWDTNVVFVTRVNDNKYYCFEISRKNCRFVEVSDSKCDILRDYVHLDN